jgi:protein phosphatase slingshot
MDTEPDPGPGEGEGEAACSGQATGVPERRGLRDRQGKSYREPAAWRRAVALEARIRQAGLTPPSQMKRSASLAKLDRLERRLTEGV